MYKLRALCPVIKQICKPSNLQLTRIQNPFIYTYQMRSFAKKTNDKKTEKLEKEKEQIKEEFADVDTDDIKSQFQDSLSECLEELDESLKNIKSGRASNDIFDEIEVKAYGEM